MVGDEFIHQKNEIGDNIDRDNDIYMGMYPSMDKDYGCIIDSDLNMGMQPSMDKDDGYIIDYIIST